MTYLIEEFRILSLAGHQFHPGEWEECRYVFCKRRYVLWREAARGHSPVEPTAATVAASDPPESINRAYELGCKHGMAAGRLLTGMEYISAVHFYIGGEPAATPLNMREATPAEADAHMMNPADRCRLSVSVMPLRRCVLKDGHNGICA